MRIIWIIYKRFETDLSRTSRIEMTRMLTKLGHRVCLVVPYCGKISNSNVADNIKFIRTLPWRGLYTVFFSLIIFFRIGFTLLTNPPDVILFEFQAFLPLVPYMLLAKLRLVKVRFVLDIRTVPVEVDSRFERLKEKLYECTVLASRFFADGITVISPLMKRQICNNYQVADERIGVWASGVSPHFLEYGEGCSMRKELFIGKDLVMMYHGVLSPSRGLQETLKAIGVLKKEGLDIGFLILGDGKAKHELESLLRDLKLEENVVLHPPVSYERVPAYISGCDLGILPFPSLNWWRVSSPLKLMEYLAMAKPVLVTEIEAHRDVIGDCSCGIFMKSSCQDEIVNGIKNVLRVKDRLPEMGQEGKRIVSTRYTWQKQAERLINFLEICISKPS